MAPPGMTGDVLVAQSLAIVIRADQPDIAILIFLVWIECIGYNFLLW
jgi:hypothetical protein